MPGTLAEFRFEVDQRLMGFVSDSAYGSAMRRSVSFTIRLGRAAILCDYPLG